MGKNKLNESTRTNIQRLYERYLLAILLNLVVLGLFAEYSHWVHARSFTVILIAALVLQLLLQLTIKLEHILANYFFSNNNYLLKLARYISSWLVLAGSKFVMLGCLSFIFGEMLHFSGPQNGMISFVLVIICMLVTEKVAISIYRSLGMFE